MFFFCYASYEGVCVCMVRQRALKIRRQGDGRDPGGAGVCVTILGCFGLEQEEGENKNEIKETARDARMYFDMIFKSH